MNARRRLPPPVSPPVVTQEARSQAAMLVAIHLYAAIGALIVARVVLRSVGVDRSFWTGEFVFGITDVLLTPLSLLPGGTGSVLGRLTLPDLTALVAVILAPIGLLAFANRS